MTIRRSVDALLAALGLLLAAPVLAVAVVGIRLSGPGPLFHRARRLGKDGRAFTMFKLRTMRCVPGSPITAPGDERIFPFGAWLRRFKLDELPQLLNVLRGEMAIVGPRPEDPDIVRRHYRGTDLETLAVRPGLTSPGSLWQTIAGDGLLDPAAPTRSYALRLLPLKLALDLEYVRHASLGYDLRVIARTVAVLARMALGRRHFGELPEMTPARAVLSGTPRSLLLALAVVLVAACSEGSTPPEPLTDWLRDPTQPLLVGAGDIASCTSSGDEATALLLDNIPGTVFTTGDNVYPNGATTEFAECYAPSWGRHMGRTHPAAGDHEYNTADAAGYFGYFGAAAGTPGEGWYGYTVGTWRILVLNSHLAMGPTSAQLAWLDGQLAADAGRCTLAYWHIPRFSSAADRATSPVSERSRAVWDLLYAAGVDVVLNGGEHHYERFAPQDPDGVADPEYGIRQFVVGTGGRSAYPFATPLANSEVRQTGTFGVLALRLGTDRYDWRFVSVAGETFVDSGSTGCHGAPPSGSTRP
jgi:lipopolysaccharide/colanic/teichoic acid biosynthesis glycosyltransferase